MTLTPQIELVANNLTKTDCKRTTARPEELHVVPGPGQLNTGYDTIPSKTSKLITLLAGGCYIATCQNIDTKMTTNCGPSSRPSPGLTNRRCRDAMHPHRQHHCRECRVCVIAALSGRHLRHRVAVFAPNWRRRGPTPWQPATPARPTLHSQELPSCQIARLRHGNPS